MKKLAIFVTGTDLGVGKTTSAIALLQAARLHGLQACGYKPVFSHPHKAWRSTLLDEDALLLQAASSPQFSDRMLPVVPVKLPPGMHAGETSSALVDFSMLSETVHNLKEQADLVVLEGLGGWRLPLNRQQSLCSWVKDEELPVVLVVAIKLGCMNHALLSAESILSRGVTLLGWIANRINPFLPYYEETVLQLCEELPGQQMGDIPFLLHQGHQGLAQHIDHGWIQSFM